MLASIETSGLESTTRSEAVVAILAQATLQEGHGDPPTLWIKDFAN